jgi:hypothetical protein
VIIAIVFLVEVSAGCDAGPAARKLASVRYSLFMKTNETGLVTIGTAKFGKMLVDEAIEANREKLKQRVVSTIQGLLSQQETLRDLVRQTESTEGLLAARIKALESGAFTLDKNGIISFKDEELNKPINFVARCAQCGYDKLVIAPVN